MGSGMATTKKDKVIKLNCVVLTCTNLYNSEQNWLSQRYQRYCRGKMTHQIMKLKDLH